MRSKLLGFVVLLIFSTTLNAQDKTNTLSWSEYISLIKTYHPVTLRANLLNDIAKARIRQAWGNFDPKLSLTYDQKYFDGTEYYSFQTPEVKLPLWYGLELKANHSEAAGAFLNPENKLPAEGLSFVGLNMSLGKGLLMDKRRAALMQSKIFSESARNEQLRILNDLVLDAGEAYLNWQNQYRVTELYKDALQLTETRYNAVKAGVAGGDRAAIDTIEALTQIQQRQLQLQQSNLVLQNYVYELSLFLWLENSEPIDAARLALVPATEEPVFSQNADLSSSNHPKLLSYKFKLRDLEIERRLKAENLRPTIDIQAGLLTRGTSAIQNINMNYWQNNNKVGLQLAFPLTFASARGELKEVKLKIRDTEFEENLIRNELDVKLKQNIAERKNLQDQLVLVNQSLDAHTKLLRGEEMRFKFGDSSLFLINTRESKLLEVQEKQLEIRNKISKNELKQIWTVGTVPF